MIGSATAQIRERILRSTLALTMAMAVTFAGVIPAFSTTYEAMTWAFGFLP